VDAVLRDYHRVPAGQAHVTDWNLSGVKGLPKDGKLNLQNLGLKDVSMRVRVGRNLAAYPLPGAMNQGDREALENTMIKAFNVLIKDPKYGGEYCSLTPGHKNQISEARYKQLVKDHIMFKDMAADTYLATAGIASDWPYGRGCYISKDRGFIVWVGEEDHLRIMCMKKGIFLNDVFDRLRNALDTMETLPGCSFAHSKEYGYVTSCPTNLGTGMRASVHVKIPNLTSDGSDAKAKAVCKPLGLSVRGMGGEHTPIGADGTVDISPSARFCIKECEIITALYVGIERLMAKERAL
jgi:protein-arginine kinase